LEVFIGVFMGFFSSTKERNDTIEKISLIAQASMKPTYFKNVSDIN